MKAKLIRNMDAAPSTPKEWITIIDGKPMCAVGLVFEHPQAYYQVLQGNAEPADLECRARVARVRTPEQVRAAVEASDKLHALVEGDDADLDSVEEDDE